MSQYANEALGRVVRDLREERGTTQEELGRAAGYGTGAGVSISRLENGLLHPGPGRFEGLAHALGLSPDELRARATALTTDGGPSGPGIAGAEHGPADGGAPTTRRSGRAKQRALRIQREVDERTLLITDLTEAFNTQHDRARDEFFLPLSQVSERIEGAPQIDPTQLLDDDPPAEDAAAARQPGSTRRGRALASEARRRGATRAAAGSAAVLTGIIATPSLIFAAGGLIFMAKRNRKQQQELAEKLDDAEAELVATRPGVQALHDLLPRAAETLDYIATHAGHALVRWEHQLGPEPRHWDSLSRAEQRRYRDFVEVADAQIRIVTIDVQGLLTTRGKVQQELIQLADDSLTSATEVVEALV